MTSLLHLRADYDYYVLAPCRGSKDTLLLIDTRIGGPPEKKTLHREFSVLQFILGQRLHLGAVAGLDDTGDVVSFSGGPYGTILRKEPYSLHQPQYPLGDNLEPSVARLAGQYAAALFRRACLTERDHPEYGLRAALTFYLTSIGEHLEGAALKLHVALEGLASKMFDVEAEASEHAGGDSTDRATALRESAALYLTTRHADWKAWCKARAGEVRAMTRPEVKDAVLDAIRRADRPGASQIVPTMLKHYGIPARSEIDRVLAARNELVHEARLPAEDNFDRLIEHQSIPRTLLVALVARVVAYTGPIIGYNPRSFDWWSLAGDLGEGENISYRAIATLDATEWRTLGREGLGT